MQIEGGEERERKRERERKEGDSILEDTRVFAKLKENCVILPIWKRHSPMVQWSNGPMVSHEGTLHRDNGNEIKFIGCGRCRCELVLVMVVLVLMVLVLVLVLVMVVLVLVMCVLALQLGD